MLFGNTVNFSMYFFKAIFVTVSNRSFSSITFFGRSKEQFMYCFVSYGWFLKGLWWQHLLDVTRFSRDAWVFFLSQKIKEISVLVSCFEAISSYQLSWRVCLIFHAALLIYHRKWWIVRFLHFLQSSMSVAYWKTILRWRNTWTCAINTRKFCFSDWYYRIDYRSWMYRWIQSL